MAIRRDSTRWDWRSRGSSLLRLLLLLAAMQVVASSVATATAASNSTAWGPILDKYLDEDGEWWQAKQRGRRAITDGDAQLILDLHNKLRGQVYPQASNMEHMVGRSHACKHAN
jgi:Ni/Co efflux regulator RcnB